MPDPVLVPAVPVVVQPSSAGDPHGVEAVKSIFDRVAPAIKGSPTPPPPPPPSPQPAPEVVTPPQKPEVGEPVQPAQPVTETKPEKEPAHDVPSFLEQALRGEAPQAQSSPAMAKEEEWPEELPAFKTPEESKQRYRKWRETYNSMKRELKNLQEKPALNAQQLARMETLEGQNRQMQEILTRMGVEHSAEFQNNILRPLHQAWNEAARIVHEAGGDAQALTKAMSLSGKAQFEALDEIFSQMPESAESEAHDALRVYRRYEDARRAAVSNAPAAMEGIRKREAERQVQELGRQRNEMESMFDRQMQRLREEAKLEVLLKTDSPDGKWWNEQGDNIVSQGRQLFLENTDMDKVAMACVLAPAADAYRKLWLNSQKKIGQLQKIIKDKLGNEPSLSESGGSQALQTSEAQMADDLKRPFSEVFLREFHKQQARR